MPKLLQIDSCLGVGSTGRITESIGRIAKNHGWDCYIVHGSRYVGESSMNSIQSGTLCQEYWHIAQSLCLDRHGLASKRATYEVITQIQDIKPDVIHLHCVHGYYINYQLLFEYLNSTEIPIVWTFHDCWAFSGHCAHFITTDCDRWMQPEGCNHCPLKHIYPKSLIDRSRYNFSLKKQLFCSNNNLHIVAVSEWLESLVRKSFLKEKDITVIHNGVDLNKFSICADKQSKKTLLGVAGSWTQDKGLYDFYKLRELLPRDEYDIVLVGLTSKQIKQLPQGIDGISRTQSIEELAKIYSQSTVFVNPTYADSFPTVNMEALACGTPVITYRTGGSPESVTHQTGAVVEQGDVEGLLNAFYMLERRDRDELRKACRSYAEEHFDKNKCFQQYINLYNDILSNN